MADLIQLLPDAIANQIAAGEVVQRPASVVKELLENAVDAGADSIQLVVKDAGKTLIQVVDNGCGMSETDARMSLERHATSKIRDAKDLFCIRTMGFRGEALASIAAIAQVELKTRRKMDEMGTRIQVEASEVKVQEPCQSAPGTSIAVKNLFYNVPARRNFLKSNGAEMKHVNEEFQRVAIAHPDIHFTLHHQNEELQHLPKGNLRQRLINIFGSSTNKKLVPVQEDTDVLKIRGFVGKPEFARKTRGEQYFFVNNRFIKSGYLNHAVNTAYEELLPKDTYPLYVLFLDIDPKHVDINVHPTKQEIKFDDERLVYNYLRVAVRHALGQHSIMPSLDFDQERGLYQTSGSRELPDSSGSVSSPGSFRPGSVTNGDSGRHQRNQENWERLYEGLGQAGDQQPPAGEPEHIDLSFLNAGDDDHGTNTVTLESNWTDDADGQDSENSHPAQKEPYQIHGTYIVSHIKSGFLLIDQQAAHERVLYERYLALMENQSASTQQQLFPRTIHLSAADADLLRQIREELVKLGFDVADFGKNTFVINGLPAGLGAKVDEKELIDQLIEQYRSGLDMNLGVRENIARAMARSGAIKRGQPLQVEEMQQLIDTLFACTLPFKSPSGRNCFVTYELEAISKQFE
jgi:DNA mismatch repair protein MutL